MFIYIYKFYLLFKINLQFQYYYVNFKDEEMRYGQLNPVTINTSNLITDFSVCSLIKRKMSEFRKP